jgi:CRP-like cAMP-binding protein
MKETKILQEDKKKETVMDFPIYPALFNGFNDDELSIISDHMTLMELDKDDILFREGDSGEYVYFVVDGKVDVIKKTSRGINIVIATLSKGRSIGEMSVIDASPRSASVKALTKATLAKLGQRDLASILENYPEIGIKVLKGISRLLCKSLRKTSSQLANHMLPIT